MDTAEVGKPCVIVHGGAGRLREDRARRKVPLMREAVEQAWCELEKGKPAEFAVAAALRVMEGSEYFNAGYGGYPNVDGIVLLDLGLMRGNRDFVSLLNVRRMKYPSAVALDLLREQRTLMTVWTHQLMNEVDAAPEFIKERYGWVSSHSELLSPVVTEWLKDDGGEFANADAATSVVSQVSEEIKSQSAGVEQEGGTVGCVVRDSTGQLAAGTSTGGVNFKDNGRIGDTPVIGSGVFADNQIGGLSTTGHGETLLLGLVSGFVLSEMRRQQSGNQFIFREQPEVLNYLVHSEFQELARKVPQRGGGLIVVPAFGDPTFSFNTQMISIAYSVGVSGRMGPIESFIAEQSGRKLS